MEKHIEMLGRIQSKADFLEFMQQFLKTAEDPAVRDYLEALTAWAADSDGYYQNAGKPIPENINWDFIAALLYAGSIYE
ncbi:MAG: hypothetical protein IK130_02195 [Oscillospiraceae bacterium]|nr:hypothetical protein [Oscillospiraceae bacterium]